MYCTKCGHLLPDTAKFCGRCGSPVQRPAPAQPGPPPVSPATGKGSRRSKLWLLLVIPVAAAALTAWFLLRDRPAGDPAPSEPTQLESKPDTQPDTQPETEAAPETEAPGETQPPEEEGPNLRTLYGEFLRQVHDSPQDYGEIDDIEACQFAIGDVDQDGAEELVISFTGTYTAAQYAGLWSAQTGRVEQIAQFGPTCQFYAGGIVQEMGSHNQTYGATIWPYRLYQWAGGEYAVLADVWCADQAIDLDGVEYQAAQDLDGDGVIYFVTQNLETAALTQAEYQDFVDQYIPAEGENVLDWQALTLENINILVQTAYVTTYRQERIAYTDSVGNRYDEIFTIPAFTLTSADAVACNKGLRLTGESAIAEAQAAMTEGYSLPCGLSYTAWDDGKYVTVVMTLSTDSDYWAYYVHTLSLPEGELQDWDDMAAAYGLTGQEARAAVADTLADFFARNYGEATQDEFYQEQLLRTCAEENLDEAVLFPDSQGNLMVMARVYSLAGADSYWYLLPVELD